MTTRIYAAVCILAGLGSWVVLGQDRTSGGKTSSALSTGLSAASRSSSANRIEAALGQAIAWDIDQVPLKEVAKRLGQRFGINVWIDSTSLSDEGIDPDIPVSLNSVTVSLKAGLELMLEPHQLAFVVDKEVLKITTKAIVEEIQYIRIYPVSDLISTNEDGDDDYSLITMFQESSSGKWEMVDGEGGTVNYVPRAGALVVRQTQSVHREIEGILLALRRVRQLPHDPSIAALPEDIEVLTPQPVRGEIRGNRRKSSVTPSPWNQPRVYSE